MPLDGQSITTAKLEPGAIVDGRYTIERLVGTGGMAYVYLAKDKKQNDLEVALKILHSEFSQQKNYVDRFVRECQLLNKINHPNIVKLFDVGTDHGLIYFTMEYVPAETLGHMLEYKSFDESQISHLIVEICSGLEVIHEKGIVHRDLKPDNILVTEDGIVKITDFGVAREESSRLTQENQKVGSICYMAPEIWLGQELTPSIDFYSLGIVLYELATGDLPFENEWTGEVMQMHLNKKPTPAILKNTRVPIWLDKLINKLLEKEPAKRPESTKEIIQYVKDNASSCFDWDETRTQSRTQILQRNSKKSARKRQKTYVFQLTSTRLIEDSVLKSKQTKPKRKATVIIPLPRSAAVILEIESPSRDFIYLGFFLASLQIFDGVLTSMGVARFGVVMEGNPLLKSLMLTFGPANTLFAVKFLSILTVGLLTFLARRIKWVKDIIGLLSCVYLFAAILPWLYILFVQYQY